MKAVDRACRFPPEQVIAWLNHETLSLPCPSFPRADHTVSRQLRSVRSRNIDILNLLPGLTMHRGHGNRGTVAEIANITPAARSG